VWASAEKQIAAPLETVWNVLSDLPNWRSWNPDVQSMEVRGPIEPGTDFVWKAGGLTIRSQIQEVVPPARIAWTGRTMTIRAVHTWVLEGHGDSTLVRTEESFEGVLASVFSGPLRTSLSKSLSSSLDALAEACEKRPS